MQIFVEKNLWKNLLLILKTDVVTITMSCAFKVFPKDYPNEI